MSTRSDSLKSLPFNTLWWEGPSFLKGESSGWPVEEVISCDSMGEEEMIVTQCFVAHLDIIGVGEIIHCSRHSSLNRLLRVTSYVIRFCNNLKTKAMNIGHVKDGEMDATDMKQSIEAVVWRCSVEKVFLEISQNSQENTCARVSFLIKLQASGLQLY